MKADESFGIVLEDATFESLNTELVDFAFGSASVVPSGTAGGGVRYLSLSGLQKLENTAKVARYAELLAHIAALMQSGN